MQHGGRRDGLVEERSSLRLAFDTRVASGAALAGVPDAGVVQSGPVVEAMDDDAVTTIYLGNVLPDDAHGAYDEAERAALCLSAVAAAVGDKPFDFSRLGPRTFQIHQQNLFRSNDGQYLAAWLERDKRASRKITDKITRIEATLDALSEAQDRGAGDARANAAEIARLRAQWNALKVEQVLLDKVIEAEQEEWDLLVQPELSEAEYKRYKALKDARCVSTKYGPYSKGSLAFEWFEEQFDRAEDDLADDAERPTEIELPGGIRLQQQDIDKFQRSRKRENIRVFEADIEAASEASERQEIAVLVSEHEEEWNRLHSAVDVGEDDPRYVALCNERREYALLTKRDALTEEEQEEVEGLQAGRRDSTALKELAAAVADGRDSYTRLSSDDDALTPDELRSYAGLIRQLRTLEAQEALVAKIDALAEWNTRDTDERALRARARDAQPDAHSDLVRLQENLRASMGIDAGRGADAKNRANAEAIARLREQVAQFSSRFPEADALFMDEYRVNYEKLVLERASRGEPVADEDALHQIMAVALVEVYDHLVNLHEAAMADALGGEAGDEAMVRARARADKKVPGLASMVAAYPDIVGALGAAGGESSADRIARLAGGMGVWLAGGDGQRDFLLDRALSHVSHVQNGILFANNAMQRPRDGLEAWEDDERFVSAPSAEVSGAATSSASGAATGASGAASAAGGQAPINIAYGEAVTGSPEGREILLQHIAAEVKARQSDSTHNAICVIDIRTSAYSSPAGQLVLDNRREPAQLYVNNFYGLRPKALYFDDAFLERLRREGGVEVVQANSPAAAGNDQKGLRPAAFVSTSDPHGGEVMASQCAYWMVRALMVHDGSNIETARSTGGADAANRAKKANVQAVCAALQAHAYEEDAAAVEREQARLRHLGFPAAAENVDMVQRRVKRSYLVERVRKSRRANVDRLQQVAEASHRGVVALRQRAGDLAVAGQSEEAETTARAAERAVTRFGYLPPLRRYAVTGSATFARALPDAGAARVPRYSDQNVSKRAEMLSVEEEGRRTVPGDNALVRNQVLRKGMAEKYSIGLRADLYADPRIRALRRLMDIDGRELETKDIADEVEVEGRWYNQLFNRRIEGTNRRRDLDRAFNQAIEDLADALRDAGKLPSDLTERHIEVFYQAVMANALPRDCFAAEAAADHAARTGDAARAVGRAGGAVAGSVALGLWGAWKAGGLRRPARTALYAAVGAGVGSVAGGAVGGELLGGAGYAAGWLYEYTRTRTGDTRMSYDLYAPLALVTARISRLEHQIAELDGNDPDVADLRRKLLDERKTRRVLQVRLDGITRFLELGYRRADEIDGEIEHKEAADTKARAIRVALRKYTTAQCKVMELLAEPAPDSQAARDARVEALVTAEEQVDICRGRPKEEGDLKSGTKDPESVMAAFYKKRYGWAFRGHKRAKFDPKHYEGVCGEDKAFEGVVDSETLWVKVMHDADAVSNQADLLLALDDPDDPAKALRKAINAWDDGSFSGKLVAAGRELREGGNAWTPLRFLGEVPASDGEHQGHQETFWAVIRDGLAPPSLLPKVEWRESIAAENTRQTSGGETKRQAGVKLAVLKRKENFCTGVKGFVTWSGFKDSQMLFAMADKHPMVVRVLTEGGIAERVVDLFADKAGGATAITGSTAEALADIKQYQRLLGLAYARAKTGVQVDFDAVLDGDRGLKRRIGGYVAKCKEKKAALAEKRHAGFKRIYVFEDGEELEDRFEEKRILSVKYDAKGNALVRRIDINPATGEPYDIDPATGNPLGGRNYDYEEVTIKVTEPQKSVWESAYDELDTKVSQTAKRQQQIGRYVPPCQLTDMLVYLKGDPDVGSLGQLGELEQNLELLDDVEISIKEKEALVIVFNEAITRVKAEIRRLEAQMQRVIALHAEAEVNGKDNPFEHLDAELLKNGRLGAEPEPDNLARRLELAQERAEASYRRVVKRPQRDEYGPESDAEFEHRQERYESAAKHQRDRAGVAVRLGLSAARKDLFSQLLEPTSLEEIRSLLVAPDRETEAQANQRYERVAGFLGDGVHLHHVQQEMELHGDITADADSDAVRAIIDQIRGRAIADAYLRSDHEALKQLQSLSLGNNEIPAELLARERQLGIVDPRQLEAYMRPFDLRLSQDPETRYCTLTMDARIPLDVQRSIKEAYCPPPDIVRLVDDRLRDDYSGVDDPRPEYEDTFLVLENPQFWYYWRSLSKAPLTFDVSMADMAEVVGAEGVVSDPVYEQQSELLTWLREGNDSFHGLDFYQLSPEFQAKVEETLAKEEQRLAVYVERRDRELHYQVVKAFHDYIDWKDGDAQSIAQFLDHVTAYSGQVAAEIAGGAQRPEFVFSATRLASQQLRRFAQPKGFDSPRGRADALLSDIAVGRALAEVEHFQAIYSHLSGRQDGVIAVLALVTEYQRSDVATNIAFDFDALEAFWAAASGSEKYNLKAFLYTHISIVMRQNPAACFEAPEDGGEAFFQRLDSIMELSGSAAESLQLQARYQEIAERRGPDGEPIKLYQSSRILDLRQRLEDRLKTHLMDSAEEHTFFNSVGGQGVPNTATDVQARRIIAGNTMHHRPLEAQLCIIYLDKPAPTEPSARGELLQSWVERVCGSPRWEDVDLAGVDEGLVTRVTGAFAAQLQLCLSPVEMVRVIYKMVEDNAGMMIRRDVLDDVLLLQPGDTGVGRVDILVDKPLFLQDILKTVHGKILEIRAADGDAVSDRQIEFERLYVALGHETQPDVVLHYLSEIERQLRTVGNAADVEEIQAYRTQVVDHIRETLLENFVALARVAGVAESNPAISRKLREMRGHIQQFGQAGGATYFHELERALEECCSVDLGAEEGVVENPRLRRVVDVLVELGNGAQILRDSSVVAASVATGAAVSAAPVSASNPFDDEEDAGPGPGPGPGASGAAASSSTELEARLAEVAKDELQNELDAALRALGTVLGQLDRWIKPHCVDAFDVKFAEREQWQKPLSGLVEYHHKILRQRRQISNYVMRRRQLQMGETLKPVLAQVWAYHDAVKKLQEGMPGDGVAVDWSNVADNLVVAESSGQLGGILANECGAMFEVAQALADSHRHRRDGSQLVIPASIGIARCFLHEGLGHPKGYGDDGLYPADHGRSDINDQSNLALMLQLEVKYASHMKIIRGEVSVGADQRERSRTEVARLLPILNSVQAYYATEGSQTLDQSKSIAKDAIATCLELEDLKSDQRLMLSLAAVSVDNARDRRTVFQSCALLVNLFDTPATNKKVLKVMNGTLGRLTRGDVEAVAVHEPGGLDTALGAAITTFKERVVLTQARNAAGGFGVSVPYHGRDEHIALLLGLARNALAGIAPEQQQAFLIDALRNIDVLLGLDEEEKADLYKSMPPAFRRVMGVQGNDKLLIDLVGQYAPGVSASPPAPIADADQAEAARQVIIDALTTDPKGSEAFIRLLTNAALGQESSIMGGDAAYEAVLSDEPLGRRALMLHNPDEDENPGQLCFARLLCQAAGLGNYTKADWLREFPGSKDAAVTDAHRANMRALLEHMDLSSLVALIEQMDNFSASRNSGTYFKGSNSVRHVHVALYTGKIVVGDVDPRTKEKFEAGMPQRYYPVAAVGIAYKGVALDCAAAVGENATVAAHYCDGAQLVNGVAPTAEGRGDLWAECRPAAVELQVRNRLMDALITTPDGANPYLLQAVQLALDYNPLLEDGEKWTKYGAKSTTLLVALGVDPDDYHDSGVPTIDELRDKLKTLHQSSLIGVISMLSDFYVARTQSRIWGLVSNDRENWCSTEAVAILSKAGICPELVDPANKHGWVRNWGAIADADVKMQFTSETGHLIVVDVEQTAPTSMVTLAELGVANGHEAAYEAAGIALDTARFLEGLRDFYIQMSSAGGVAAVRNSERLWTYLLSPYPAEDPRAVRQQELFNGLGLPGLGRSAVMAHIGGRDGLPEGELQGALQAFFAAAVPVDIDALVSARGTEEQAKFRGFYTALAAGQAQLEAALAPEKIGVQNACMVLNAFVELSREPIAVLDAIAKGVPDDPSNQLLKSMLTHAHAEYARPLADDEEPVADVIGNGLRGFDDLGGLTGLRAAGFEYDPVAVDRENMAKNAAFLAGLKGFYLQQRSVEVTLVRAGGRRRGQREKRTDRGSNLQQLWTLLLSNTSRSREQRQWQQELRGALGINGPLSAVLHTLGDEGLSQRDMRDGLKAFFNQDGGTNIDALVRVHSADQQVAFRAFYTALEAAQAPLAEALSPDNMSIQNANIMLNAFVELSWPASRLQQFVNGIPEADAELAEVRKVLAYAHWAHDRYDGRTDRRDAARALNVVANGGVPKGSTEGSMDSRCPVVLSGFSADSAARVAAGAQFVLVDRPVEAVVEPEAGAAMAVPEVVRPDLSTPEGQVLAAVRAVLQQDDRIASLVDLLAGPGGAAGVERELIERRKAVRAALYIDPAVEGAELNVAIRSGIDRLTTNRLNLLLNEVAGSSQGALRALLAGIAEPVHFHSAVEGHGDAKGVAEGDEEPHDAYFTVQGNEVPILLADEDRAEILAGDYRRPASLSSGSSEFSAPSSAGRAGTGAAEALPQEAARGIFLEEFRHFLLEGKSREGAIGRGAAARPVGRIPNIDRLWLLLLATGGSPEQQQWRKELSSALGLSAKVVKDLAVSLSQIDGDDDKKLSRSIQLYSVYVTEGRRDGSLQDEKTKAFFKAMDTASAALHHHLTSTAMTVAHACMALNAMVELTGDELDSSAKADELELVAKGIRGGQASLGMLLQGVSRKIRDGSHVSGAIARGEAGELTVRAARSRHSSSTVLADFQVGDEARAAIVAAAYATLPPKERLTETLRNGLLVPAATGEQPHVANLVNIILNRDAEALASAQAVAAALNISPELFIAARAAAADDDAQRATLTAAVVAGINSYAFDLNRANLILGELARHEDGVDFGSLVDGSDITYELGGTGRGARGRGLGSYRVPGTDADERIKIQTNDIAQGAMVARFSERCATLSAEASLLIHLRGALLRDNDDGSVKTDDSVEAGSYTPVETLYNLLTVDNDAVSTAHKSALMEALGLDSAVVAAAIADTGDDGHEPLYDAIEAGINRLDMGSMNVVLSALVADNIKEGGNGSEVIGALVADVADIQYRGPTDAADRSLGSFVVGSDPDLPVEIPISTRVFVLPATGAAATGAASHASSTTAFMSRVAPGAHDVSRGHPPGSHADRRGTEADASGDERPAPSGRRSAPLSAQPSLRGGTGVASTASRGQEGRGDDQRPPAPAAVAPTADRQAEGVLVEELRRFFLESGTVEGGREGEGAGGRTTTNLERCIKFLLANHADDSREAILQQDMMAAFGITDAQVIAARAEAHTGADISAAVGLGRFVDLSGEHEASGDRSPRALAASVSDTSRLGLRTLIFDGFHDGVSNANLGALSLALNAFADSHRDSLAGIASGHTADLGRRALSSGATTNFGDQLGEFARRGPEDDEILARGLSVDVTLADGPAVTVKTPTASRHTMMMGRDSVRAKMCGEPVAPEADAASRSDSADGSAAQMPYGWDADNQTFGSDGLRCLWFAARENGMDKHDERSVYAWRSEGFNHEVGNLGSRMGRGVMRNMEVCSAVRIAGSEREFCHDVPGAGNYGQLSMSQFLIAALAGCVDVGVGGRDRTSSMGWMLYSKVCAGDAGAGASNDSPAQAVENIMAMACSMLGATKPENQQIVRNTIISAVKILESGLRDRTNQGTRSFKKAKLLLSTAFDQEISQDGRKGKTLAKMFEDGMSAGAMEDALTRSDGMREVASIDRLKPMMNVITICIASCCGAARQDASALIRGSTKRATTVIAPASLDGTSVTDSLAGAGDRGSIDDLVESTR